MFKITSLVLSLTAALQLVCASSVTITSPSPNDVWEAGSTVQIKWKVNEANSKPLRIQYASGPSKALKINGLIADKVNASAGHYNWKVPKDLKSKKYVIEIGPSASDLSFAGYIHLKEKSKKTTSTKKHSTTKKHTTKKHSTKKHTTKKTTQKKSPKKVTTKKTSKKHTSTKKYSTKKGTESAVCVGKPTSGDGETQSVRCQSVPKYNKSSSKKHTTTKKHTTAKKD